MPGPEFFYKMGLCDLFIFQDDVQFKEEHAKAAIKTPRGRMVLKVPVRQKKAKLHEVEIAGDLWRGQHWNALSMAYRGCKYHEILSEFWNFYGPRSWDNLARLNIKIAKFTKNVLGWNLVKFARATELDSGDGTTLRQWIKDHDGILIRLRFQAQEYRQLHGKFSPNLSFMDFLFNCGGRGKYDPRTFFGGQ